MTLPAQEATPTDPGQGVETADPAPQSAPEAQPAAQEPSPEVQPADDAGAQPDGGQGLIASYLEGVDENVRGTVADVLERYRQDSDARVTKKFEQLNAYQQFAQDPAELETPVALYENLLEKPADTIRWIFDQFSDAGIDLKAELLGEAQAAPEAQPQPTSEGTPDDPDRPLTRREFEQLQQEQQQRAQQEQEASVRRKTVESWFNEATTEKGLELGDQDVAVKQAILQHAAQLLPQLAKYGDEAGKHAINTAVEAFVNRFGKNASEPKDTPAPEPRLADGGTPPAPQQVDLSDQKARKQWMLQQLVGANSQE